MPAAVALIIALALSACPSSSSAAGALASQCDRTALPVLDVDGSPALVAAYGAPLPQGAPGSLQLDGVSGTASMVALPDAAAYVHATTTVASDRVALVTAHHTLSIARVSGAVTLDGSPVNKAFAPPAPVDGTTYVDAGAFALLSNRPADAFVERRTELPVRRSDGTSLSIPALCAPVAPTSAEAAILALTHPHGPASIHPSIWCDVAPGVITPYTIASVSASHPPPAYMRNEAVNERAHAELCNGALAYAAQDYASLKTWYVVPDGTKLIDFERHYVLTQSLAGSPDKAFSMLSPEAGLKAATSAYFKGDDCTAMRAFAAADGQRQMTPDQHDAYQKSGPPPELARAVVAVCAGDDAKARAIMRTLPSAALYDLIIGNLEARAHDWRGAAVSWWTAAGDYPEIPVPEWVDFDAGGPTALEMLWYYRAHLPRI